MAFNILESFDTCEALSSGPTLSSVSKEVCLWGAKGCNFLFLPWVIFVVVLDLLNLVVSGSSR